MSVPAIPECFTARELAGLVAARGLKGFPASERGWQVYADREGWNAFPPRLARMRLGTGRPAMEYHLSILPERLQAAIEADRERARLSRAIVDEGEADRRRIAAIRATALSPEARKVMEARAEVLTSIEGYAAAQGESRAWAIARFLEAQDQAHARQDIERRRDSGDFLTEREAASLAQPLLLTKLDGFQLPLARLAAANDRKKVAKVSRSSLYDWFKARDSQTVIALAPVPPKERQPVPEEFFTFLRFYAKPQKLTITEAHKDYMDAAAKRTGVQPMTLTIDQVSYILNKRMNGIERQVGREGLLTLRSRMAYVTRTTEDMWPTTIYTADGKSFAAEIADPDTFKPIRPEISTVIDVVTRRIVGTSFARSENQRSVAEALRNSCVFGGIPAIFYVDRGPGYRNDALDADISGLMGRLGITKMHAAPYNSQAKGRVERPNATVWDVLAKRFDTYIGEDMDKEAGKKIHDLTRREIKEFGQSRHLPTWEEFVAKALAMVEEYNNRPHRGLPKFVDPETGKRHHMTPNEAWAAHVASGFEPVPVDAEEVDDLFRPYEFRTVRRGLVQWNKNFYYHEALEARPGERVMVGYDYAQAHKVWVREYDVETGQPGRLICVAEFNANAERYVPVSYEEQALENRTNSRLKRVDRKREDIEAERDALRLVDMQPLTPAPFIDLAPVPEPEPVRHSADSETTNLPRRRVFASDEELAIWALAHPTELTPNQIAVLRDCMSRPAARDLFRMSGIDLEALRTLLRAAA